MYMTRTGKKQIEFLLAAAAVVAAAFFVFAWKGAFLSEPVRWEDRAFSWEGCDVVLKDRTLTLYDGGSRIWSSDWDWSVQTCEKADLDGDGMEELLLLVWKRGSYGDHMPFWVERNDHDLAQHIFIYRREKSRSAGIRPAWMSSQTGFFINGMYTDTGRVVLEKEDGSFSLWQWEGFGLKQLADPASSFSVLACGDQLLHASVISPGMKNNDYSYMYADIRDVIISADLSSLNQETPLVRDKALVSDYPRFASPFETADAVADLGIDVVTTANNHALDQGMNGIDTTIRVYEDLGILPVGTHASSDDAEDVASAVRLIERNGVKTALLSFTYGTNLKVSGQGRAVEYFTDTDRLTGALAYARENADAVIVYAHWGTEYAKQLDEEQENLTDLLLRQGVDVVIGTHPHVLQPYEILTGADGHKMLVYYSLGNLISAQEAEECRHGGIASFTLVKSGRGRVVIVKPDLLKIYTEQRSVRWE